MWDTVCISVNRRTKNENTIVHVDTIPWVSATMRGSAGGGEGVEEEWEEGAEGGQEGAGRGREGGGMAKAVCSGEFKSQCYLMKMKWSVKNQ